MLDHRLELFVIVKAPLCTHSLLDYRLTWGSISSRPIALDARILGLCRVELLGIFELTGPFDKEPEWLSVSVLLIHLDLSEERELML